MKNVLTHESGSPVLLANVDDGTNRLFINDEEIPSSSWVGTGTYTKIVDGVTITISKIINLSGNIVLKKVTNTSFRLIRKAEALQPSYIGMVTTSTTLDTLDKVREVFGSDTTWIQHSDYVLRGATSGVIENSAAKTGGNDNAIIPYHYHSVSRQLLAESAGSHNHYQHFYISSAESAGKGLAQPDQGFTNRVLIYQSATNQTVYLASGGAHQHYISAHNTKYAGEDVTNKNIPNYKSVYIWERVS